MATAVPEFSPGIEYWQYSVVYHPMVLNTGGGGLPTSWDWTRVSEFLRLAAFPCGSAPTLRQVKYRKWRVSEVPWIVRFPSHDTRYFVFPPHFLSTIRNFIKSNSTFIRSDTKISLKRCLCRVGGRFSKIGRRYVAPVFSIFLLLCT